MKILLATNSYPPAIGGAEIACKRIANILSSEHEITIVTKKDGKVREIENEKEIIELDSKTIYSYMPKLKNVLEEKEYDLYISFGFGKYFFDYIGDWCKKNKKKCISIPIGYFHTRSALLFKETYKHFLARNSLNNYDLIITATQQEKDFWTSKFKIKKDKIKVIPHTLEDNYTKFTPTNILKKNSLKPKQYVFYIGRLAINKRPDLLIRAYSQISTNVKLVIAGKETKNEELQKIANKNTIFLGEVTDDEKKELIKNARLCVFPSEYESYGLFIAEAAEFNTPIIASNIPSFRELIQNKEYLFENNESSLKKKLKELIKTPKTIKLRKVDQKKEYLEIVKIIANETKKIKIFMQYPWVVADSPYYKYLFDYPPKNADYLNPVIKSKDVTTSNSKLKSRNQLKDIIRKTAILNDLPIPNVRVTLEQNCDLVHSAHCISITNKPWIVDFESYWQIVVGSANNKLSVNISKKLLETNNCKKIICWTQHCKEKLIELTKSDKIKNKLVIVYPAVPINPKTELNKKINLLFVARYFYEKGGDVALMAMNEVTKKHKNITATIVSPTPPELLKKYSTNKNIKFYNLMPREELFKLYSKSTLFIYPGFTDTFGFSFLEAMSFGLPIITVEGMARKEIIENGKTGYIIPRKDRINFDEKEKIHLAKEIANKTNSLINNRNLINKMSENAHQIVKEGKFSIQHRNKQMEKIYSEAVKEQCN